MQVKASAKSSAMRFYEVIFNEVEGKENVSVDYLSDFLFFYTVFSKRNKRTGFYVSIELSTIETVVKIVRSFQSAYTIENC